MLKGILFFEPLAEKIEAVTRDVAAFIDKKVGTVSECVPCEINRKEIVKVLPSNIQNAVNQAIPDELVAIRFYGHNSSNLLYKNWVMHSMLQAEKKYGCLVAIKVKDYYVRYFAVDGVSQEIRLIAAGTNALSACQYVHNEVLKFDVMMFDSDGYRK